MQVNVDIRNVSGSSRQMRIIPLNSPYFTVTRGWEILSPFLDHHSPHRPSVPPSFPLFLCPGMSTNSEGLIAPGMHATCTIGFTPHSLCNYREEVKVHHACMYMYIACCCMYMYITCVCTYPLFMFVSRYRVTMDSVLSFQSWLSDHHLAFPVRSGLCV